MIFKGVIMGITKNIVVCLLLVAGMYVYGMDHSYWLHHCNQKYLEKNRQELNMPAIEEQLKLLLQGFEQRDSSIEKKRFTSRLKNKKFKRELEKKHTKNEYTRY